MNKRLVSPEYRLEVSVEFVISFTLKKNHIPSIVYGKDRNKDWLGSKEYP